MVAGQVGIAGPHVTNPVELVFKNVPDPARIHQDVMEEVIAMDHRRKNNSATSNRALVRNKTHKVESRISLHRPKRPYYGVKGHRFNKRILLRCLSLY